MNRSRIRLEANQPPDATPVFLTVREAAEFLRLSEITLGRWRIEGVGPPYHKPSKTGLGACSHFELRFTSAESLQTGGSGRSAKRH